MSPHSLNSLKRWSCADNDLPDIQHIKYIHVYDFDNTLFCSPLPNFQLWNSSTVSSLQQQTIFRNGGWWHDVGILGCTGEGIEKEEKRAWEGWWNETIVSLVELSMQQTDAVIILLTGRYEPIFADLIQRILASKKLKFDLICLKPEAGPANQKFGSTMKFKQAFLEDLINTYRAATELRIYEDRPKHIKGFREFFSTLNESFLSSTDPEIRKPITVEVIEVAEQVLFLDPVVEIAQVQRMINAHNVAYLQENFAHAGSVPWKIQRSVFFTGYLISTSDTKKLSSLVEIPSGTPDGEIRFLANSIVITPRPCPKPILDRVGGIGKKVRWRVIGFSLFQNKIWAAKVEPVSPNERVYSDNSTPLVVLALRRNARPMDANRIQNWQPVSRGKAFEFDTVVGEKVLLRLEQEFQPEEEPEGRFKNGNQSAKKGFKRPPPLSEGFLQLGGSQNTIKAQRNGPDFSNSLHRPGQGEENRRQHGHNGLQRGTNNSGHRGGRRDHRYDRSGGGGGRGGGRSGYARGRARARGGYGGNYRSLDDEAGDSLKSDGGLTY